MPWSVRIATAPLLALGVVLVVAGRVTAGDGGFFGGGGDRGGGGGG
jgi:hypothetical protein